MRLLTTGLLAGAAILSLSSCNKAAPAGGASAQTASAAPAAPSGPIPLTADSMPHRKPGLWRQTMEMEGAPQNLPAAEFCTDAASETKMSLMGQQMSRGHCDAPRFARNADGSISFTSACDMGPEGKTTSSGTVTGDFNSAYKMAIDVTQTGAPVAAANGEHKMTMSATWLGPCAPGQKGGDIILPGGRTMNMTSGQ